MVKIFAVLVAIFVFQASGHAADKIRISVPALAGQLLPLPLAQKMGFFHEEGLQVEFVRMRGAAAARALVSGELDYYTVITAPVRAAIQGLPVRVVACFMPSAPTVLIARPEVKSVQELRGKTVAISIAGGTVETLSKLILKHFGLDPDKEVKFHALGRIKARFAAMEQGRVAATLGSSPHDFLGKKMGFVVLARSAELFNYPVSGLITSVKKIKERPEEVKRVIRAGIKANRYIRENPEGTIQFMAEWLKIDKEMAKATHKAIWKAFNKDGSVPEDGLRLVIEEVKKSAKVGRQVSLSEVADLSILKQVQKELRIENK